MGVGFQPLSSRLCDRRSANYRKYSDPVVCRQVGGLDSGFRQMLWMEPDLDSAVYVLQWDDDGDDNDDESCASSD